MYAVSRQVGIRMISNKEVIAIVVAVTVLIATSFSAAYANSSINDKNLATKCDETKKYASLDSLYFNPKKIIRTTFKTIPSDLSGIVKFPFHNKKIALPFVVASIGLIAVDRQTTEFVQKKVDPKLTWTPPSLSFAQGTDGYMLLGLGALYAGGTLFKSSVNAVAALAAIKSVGYSVLFTQVALKTAFGRLRPNPNLSNSAAVAFPYSQNYSTKPWDFFKRNSLSLFSKSNDTSMPSFHFTMYFAIGTALSQVYNSYLPYVITAAGLLPNFSCHHHWVSDMFVGGGIGTLIGYVTANNLKNRLNCSDKSFGTLTPAVIKDGVALRYNVTFFE